MYTNHRQLALTSCHQSSSHKPLSSVSFCSVLDSLVNIDKQVKKKHSTKFTFWLFPFKSANHLKTNYFKSISNWVLLKTISWFIQIEKKKTCRQPQSYACFFFLFFFFMESPPILHYNISFVLKLRWI